LGSSSSQFETPATLCGKSLRGVMHACVFVNSREEQYDILLPYLQDGLMCNAHIATMVGEANLRDHHERLKRAGMDPDRLAQLGKLSISTAEETFRRDGSVTPMRILEHWEKRIDAAQRLGFSAVRGFCEMDWALAALRRTEELLEYEAHLNFLALKLINPVVCVYDVNNVSGRMVMDILSTHPKVILGGRLQENPHFESPQAYLRQLEERRRKRPRSEERRASMLARP
jgi:hypothetical protein